MRKNSTFCRKIINFVNNYKYSNLILGICQILNKLQNLTAMKRNEYITPELQHYSYRCEQGYNLSSNIGDWGEGGNHEGSAE